MKDLVIALREKIEDVRPGLRRQALESTDSLRVGNVVLIDFLNRLHGMLDNLERNPAAWRAIESHDDASIQGLCHADSVTQKKTA